MATFVKRISNGGTRDWSPRSPDITHCNFYIWGIIEDNIFFNVFVLIIYLNLLLENAFEYINNNKELIWDICIGYKLHHF